MSEWQRCHGMELAQNKKIYLKLQKTDSKGMDNECRAYFALCSTIDRFSKAVEGGTLEFEDAIKYTKEIPKLIQSKRELEVILKYRLQGLEEEKNLGKEISTIDRIHNENRAEVMKED